jgi:hypothetical protein
LGVRPFSRGRRFTVDSLGIGFQSLGVGVAYRVERPHGVPLRSSARGGDPIEHVVNAATPRRQVTQQRGGQGNWEPLVRGADINWWEDRIRIPVGGIPLEPRLLLRLSDCVREKGLERLEALVGHAAASGAGFLFAARQSNELTEVRLERWRGCRSDRGVGLQRHRSEDRHEGGGRRWKKGSVLQWTVGCIRGVHVFPFATRSRSHCT